MILEIYCPNSWCYEWDCKIRSLYHFI